MQAQDLAPSAPLQGMRMSRSIGIFCSALGRGRRGKRSKMVGTWVMYYEHGESLLHIHWALRLSRASHLCTVTPPLQ